MEVECYSKSEVEIVVKEPPRPGPEGESPTPDCDEVNSALEPTTDEDTIEGSQTNVDEKQKQSKIQTLKRLVTRKAKPKNEENDKEESSTIKGEKTRSSRELRKSLSRVFSVSSSSIGRVWSSFSATRIHGEGESGSTPGKMFGRKAKPGPEDRARIEPEVKSQTLGRRFSATFRNAFGRSRES